MHLGRFNSAVRELDSYYKSLNAVEQLSAAANEMRSYSSSKDPNILKAMRERLYVFASLVEDIPASFLLPSTSDLFTDLGVSDSYGAALSARVRALTEIRGVPEEVVEAVETLRVELAETMGDVASLSDRLVRRGVELVTLGAEEAEFGVTFPKELVGESASDLVTELEHINRLFMAFNALLGRGTESPKVRTIASSAWQFFLELDANQINAWTQALERIVTLLGTGYAIRAARQALEGMPIAKKEWIEDAEKQELEHYKNGATEIAADIRAKFGSPDLDSATAADHENRLRSEVLHLVRRINGGAVIEVRLGQDQELAENTDEEDQEPSDEVQKLRAAHVAKLQERRQLNAKLADLSHKTSQLPLREDLKLEDLTADTGKQV